VKIYRVVYTETGAVRSLWGGYRSACGSAAQARCDAQVQVAHVPDELFKPVDKAQESRLARLHNLWWALDEKDAEQALEVLRNHLLQRQRVMPAIGLGKRAKAEAEALLAMDRLVDAQ
jgi:hypothetical protein